MIVLYIILFIVVLFSLRKLPEGKVFNDSYISIDTSNIVKGICIWIVFICHISSYMHDIPALSDFDKLIFSANSYVKQLLVVPFLFYSGYGVTLAIKNKKGYGEGIIMHRIFPTLVNFDIAILFFLIMNIALGIKMEEKIIILSFIGWESIGNSNWYIFCIIFCYFISWLSYRLFGSCLKMIYSIIALVVMYTVIMFICRKGPWWYDTVYAYAFGSFFAWFRDDVWVIIHRKYKYFTVLALIGFLLSYNAPNTLSFSANVSAVFLCCLVLLFTMKIRLNSPFLMWSGKHLFPLYIYQRIPMIIFSTVAGGAFMNSHRYYYVILCFVLTLLFALLYRYINFSFRK